MGELQFIWNRLDNYNKFKSFDKRFIQVSGPHIKGMKLYEDNIKIKLKRNLFIQINADKNVYLINSGELPKQVQIKIGTKSMKGLRLFGWGKLSAYELCSKIEGFIEKPERVYALAISLIDPILIAKSGSKQFFGIRESELAEAREYSNINLGAEETRDLSPKIRAKRRG